MRALVTGGNGHLGFNLVTALDARGYDVRATVRSLKDPAKTMRLQALGSVEIVEADVRNEAQMQAALQDIDLLFHAAAVYTITDKKRENEMSDFWHAADCQQSGNGVNFARPILFLFLCARQAGTWLVSTHLI